MAILNVGSTLRDLCGPNNGHDSTPGGFDPQYSNRAVSVDLRGSDAFGEAPRLVSRFSPPGGDLWLHFRVVMPDLSGGTGAIGAWFSFFDGSNRRIGGVRISSGTHSIEVDDGSATTLGISWTPVSLETADYDVRVIVDTNIQIDVYKNQILVSSASMPNTDRTSPTSVHFDHGYFTAAANQKVRYSELIIADGESTLGWRLATSDPDTIGFHTGWGADIAALKRLETGSRISSRTLGDRMSWSPTAYTGPATPSNIRGVVTKALFHEGNSGVDKVSQFLRISGTDYDGSAQIGNFMDQGNIEVWDNNPGTVMSWVTADFVGIEIGLLATT